MKFFLLSLFFILFLFLEVTFTSLPLVFLFLLTLAVFFPGEWIFLIALCTGIILDAVSFRNLGESSIFFILFFCTLFLYQQKFEIRSYPFILTSSAIGSFLFLFIFGFSHLFIQTVVSIFFGFFLFKIFSLFFPSPRRPEEELWYRE